MSMEKAITFQELGHLFETSAIPENVFNNMVTIKRQLEDGGIIDGDSDIAHQRKLATYWSRMFNANVQIIDGVYKIQKERVAF